MILRAARPADGPTLERWMQKPHVIAATGGDFDDVDWGVEFARTVDWREQLIAEVDGRPTGYIEIYDPALEETHYWGDVAQNLRALDIWIGEEADLGKGYGTTMMELALERCFAPAAVTAVLIDPLASNTKAHPFYERLGFRKLREQVFNDVPCIIYELTRARWDSAH